MIFVQTIRDRYVGSSNAAKNEAAGVGWAEDPFIRRPTRGIQIKEDTFATIRVVAAEGGKNKLLVDAGSKRTDSTTKQYLQIGGKQATDIYSNFLLQQVQEERAEKQQILETFGEAYIFLFGQRARVITFSGILANTFDFNWEAEWWHNYDNYLRGTKCVENDARVYISYDNTLVGGYIISTSSAKDTMNKNHVQFTFQLFVTYYSNFSDVGNPYAFAGNVTMRGMSYGKETVDRTYSQAELDQYRPYPVEDIPIQEGPLIGNGKTVSLFASLEAGVAKAKDAWGKTQQVVESALDRVSGLLNVDNGVRIPIGFAGSLVFNDSAALTPPTINEYAGRVQYTIFADNDDEYVGVGSHYGSSFWSLADPAVLAGFGETTKNQTLDYSQDMVRKASFAWAKAGYKIPETSLGPVSSFLVSKTLGLAAVGTTALWQFASNAIQPGSADPPNFAQAGVLVAGIPIPTSPIE